MTAEMARQPSGASSTWHLAAQFCARRLLSPQIAGHVIPSDVPGSLALALRQPVELCWHRAMNAPRDLGCARSPFPGLRQYCCFKASEMCPATASGSIGSVSARRLDWGGSFDVADRMPADAPAVGLRP